MAKKIKGPAWDSGLPPVEVSEIESKPKPKQIRRRRNKKVSARAYCMAYKAIMRGISPELKRKVLDPLDNGPESRQFVKTVIALAEHDDK